MHPSTGIASASPRTAVFTGAASGIGLAVAQHLTAQGHRVALLDRRAEAAESAAAPLRETGAEATAYACDVSDRGAVAAAIQAAREAYGPITVSVTSAGVETFASVTDITPDAWDR
ncbi:SDR family NAD(P)-dependent oxidoreductase [Streptomyces hokutonensis]|uniref:SDR family NAD(P)-dependent oxidoreductase n=1 Tax=Streptomyces hokutonensis TaxID=1306990 RepID=UPI0033EDB436